MSRPCPGCEWQGERLLWSLGRVLRNGSLFAAVSCLERTSIYIYIYIYINLLGIPGDTRTWGYSMIYVYYELLLFENIYMQNDAHISGLQTGIGSFVKLPSN